MSAAEKEELIIKLNDERRDLIKEAIYLESNSDGEINNMLRSVDISRRLFAIDMQIKELTESEQSNCS